LKFISKSIQLGNKVVIGFVLATILVASVSLITYYSILNLLDTVENLSEPNERLQNLNGLLADVYLLDMSKSERTSDKDSVLELTINRIKSRLDWLEDNSSDTTENRIFEQIGLNISELLVVYAGLEEITFNLNSRNFSEEALQNVERRIKRQQELSEAQFLGGLSNRDLFSELRPQRRTGDTINTPPAETMEEVEAAYNDVLEEDLIEIVKDLEELRAAPNAPIRSKAQSDSALLAIRNFVAAINRDERRLRKSFSSLENQLLAKNKEVFFQIQSLISSMQQDVLKEYKNQNESAYNLTSMVSGILAFLVFLGVIGSLGFVYSILKEVKKADTYRKKLEEAKRQSDNLAKAKQDFLANMSHEIRNPLHAIAGFQQALHNTGLNTNQREFVKMIGFASNTLMAIVNDILDFSKLEAGKIQIESIPFDPLKLFYSIKSFFGFKAEEKGIDFNWDIRLPEGKWLQGDALRINQILNNLISNAIKFTEKGQVSVTVAYQEGQDRLLMEVKDTGLGMSQEVLANIFQEFNQGDTSVTRRFGGTGLGLAIVKKLVDLQKGKVEVESQEDKGTLVRVVIPIAIVTPSEDLVDENALTVFSMHGLKVLVVDDDPINLKLIQLLLESKGSSVATYQGGAAFKADFPDAYFDLVLLDIQMPQVSGIEVLGMLRADPVYAEIPVVAMTANVFANERNALLDAGFDTVLLKPFNEDGLVSLIGELLGLRPVSKHSVKLNPIDEPKQYDLTDLKGFCMGDEDLLAEIVSDLLETTELNLQELAVAVSVDDYSKIREITHQLSSRMAQIRVAEGALAKEIEILIKENQLVQVKEKTNLLIQKLQIILAGLKSDYLATKS
jgi:signal transduction histidine kinase/CheY-like chemotaxis protein/uncharacterized protein YkuJ